MDIKTQTLHEINQKTVLNELYVDPLTDCGFGSEQGRLCWRFLKESQSCVLFFF